jgi:hypothetical protein
LAIVTDRVELPPVFTAPKSMLEGVAVRLEPLPVVAAHPDKTKAKATASRHEPVPRRIETARTEDRGGMTMRV